MQNDREIIIRPAAISAPHTISVPRGLTIAEMVNTAIRGPQIGALAADLNGEPVPADKWANITPAESDHILIYTTLGNGMGDNPLRTILSIVVIAAASYFGGPAAGALGFKIGTAGYAVASAVATAAIATAGMMLVDAIAPIRGLQSNRQNYSDSQAYSIAGGSNRARPFGVIPMNLGRNKVFPDVLGSYTEIVGNDEYLRMLFCWGYGPQKIEYIKIGDTLINEYDDVQIENREGFDTDTDITLYPSQVSQTLVGVDLNSSDGYTTRTISAGADEISWDIEFPRGLMQIDSNGNRQNVTVLFDIGYRVSGGSWVNVSGPKTFSAQYISTTGITAVGTHTIWISPSDGPYVLEGTSRVNAANIILGTFVISQRVVHLDEHDSYEKYVSAVNDLNPSGVSGLSVSLISEAIYMTAGTATFPAISITDKTATALRRSWKISVNRAYAHEIRIWRTTADSDNDRIIDQCRWNYTRAITNDAPINFPHALALTAVRIKASGQINGTIDNLSGICTSYAEMWGGTAWGGSIPTQNQAALARLALMGPANFKPRTTSQMDEDTFGDWYELCESEGYEFNMIRDYQSSVWDAFFDIAATARAAPSLPDGKWSVVMDVSGKSIKQHITPRNSWGFSSNKPLFEIPHAFRVKFKNEDTDFDWDEVVVYDDGYTSVNATNYETIEFPGITNSDLAWKFGRFHIAQVRLRPEEYSLFMDFEHMACSRGDLVRVSHDVSEWGGGQGRVKSLATSGANTTGVVLDETVAMLGGHTYACRFRMLDGTSLVVSIVTSVGETATLTFSTPIATSSGPAVGDLAMFGETDLESVELLVKRIERQSDFVARLVMVDLAEAIYDADTGEIPDFDSQVTAPIDITKIIPGVPSISNIDSGDAALERVGSTFRPRILASAKVGTGTVRIAKFSVRYRILGTSPWSYASCTIDEPTAVISNVIELETYELSIQAVSIYGAVSAWSSNYIETVIGSSEIPSDVEDFRIEIVGTTAYLTWSKSSDIDLAGYKIKFTSETSGAVWIGAYTQVELVPREAVSVQVPARTGTYLIKAIDYGGRESENAVSVINLYGDILDMNVVETITEDPGFSGTHDGTEVSGSVLQLVNTSGVIEIDTPSGIDIDDPSGIEIDEAQAASTLSDGYYYFATSIDLGDVYTNRVTSAIISGGINLLDDVFLRADWFEVDDFFGVEVGDWDVIAQLRYTPDDPAGTPTWSSWLTFNVGDFTGRGFEFRVLLRSLAAGISPGITDLSVIVDMPDRHIAGDDLTCTVTGLRVNFTPPFYGFKGVGFAYQDMDTGDYGLVTNKDATGFDINFYDSADSPVERTFDYVAAGYGRKVV